MIGVGISFSTQPSVFDFTVAKEDFDTSIQNALVVAATRSGSDQVFPDKGTTLLADANQGGFTDINTANQSASFAANEVLIFSQLNDSSDNPNRLASFKLTSVSIENQSLTLSAYVADVSGNVAGVNASM